MKHTLQKSRLDHHVWLVQHLDLEATEVSWGLTWLDRGSGFWCPPGYSEERCRGRSSGWSLLSVWSSHQPVTRRRALPSGSGTPRPEIENWTVKSRNNANEACLRENRLGVSLTKHASSLRVIVTIRLSCGTWSWQILLILMSVISLKSEKVCHCQNKRNRRQKLCFAPQIISKNPDKLIWISPHLHHNFYWFESRIPQWPEPERQLNGGKRGPRGRSRCPEKAGCRPVQSGTWASGCSHLPGSSQSSSRNAWGWFGSDNVPPSFVSLCQRDVTLEGTIYSWNRNSLLRQQLLENCSQRVTALWCHWVGRKVPDLSTWRSCTDLSHSGVSLWPASTGPAQRGRGIRLGWSKAETILPRRW